MKQLLLICFLALNSLSFTQTKMIFHKSHSGSSKNFIAGIKHNNSNFGMAPTRTVRNSKLDSVILVDDHIAVMVTSEYCTEFDRGSNTSYGSHLWSAGKDTVYNHPLFNKEKSVAEIQKTLREEYFFANDISDVKLIGFDKKTKGQYDIAEPDFEPTFEPDEREALYRQSIENRNKKYYTKKGRRKLDPFTRWLIFGWLTIFINQAR